MKKQRGLGEPLRWAVSLALREGSPHERLLKGCPDLSVDACGAASRRVLPLLCNEYRVNYTQHSLLFKAGLTFYEFEAQHGHTSQTASLKLATSKPVLEKGQV